MSLITIIGRGHSGTRAMSHTLTASGIFMGEPQNNSGDLLPPGDMYDACRVLGRYVKWLGGLEWDFSALFDMPIPQEFTDLIHSFLRTVLACRDENKGWKIPETTLCYPWIQRMFPDAKYIFWIRNPRDCILGSHVTDDLRDFNIQYPLTEDVRERRAISWLYQYKLVKATPRPKYWMEVRLEDFVLRQDETLARLESFLGVKMAKIPAQRDPVGRWQRDEGVSYYDFFAPAMREYDYPMPESACAEQATTVEVAH